MKRVAPRGHRRRVDGRGDPRVQRGSGADAHLEEAQESWNQRVFGCSIWIRSDDGNIAMRDTLMVGQDDDPGRGDHRRSTGACARAIRRRSRRPRISSGTCSSTPSVTTCLASVASRSTTSSDSIRKNERRCSRQGPTGPKHGDSVGRASRRCDPTISWQRSGIWSI